MTSKDAGLLSPTQNIVDLENCKRKGNDTSMTVTSYYVVYIGDRTIL
ncbi:MAG: hypothetical protein WA461_09490 [Nitrososphaeraceae archaeon]